MAIPLMGCFRWRSALVLVILAVAARPALAGFTIRDLGVLAPMGTSAGSSINSVGQVAGSATTAFGALVAVKTDSVGGTFQQIGDPYLTRASWATSINVAGNVAGTYIDGMGISHGFTTSSGGVSTISPLAGGTYTQASGINSSGQTVGTGDIAGGLSRAFIATGGGQPTAIDPLGTGTFNQGNGINDNGTVVGSSAISPGGLIHAFIATSNKPAIDLLTRNSAGIFAYNTYGMAIANNGDVAGYGDVGHSSHAFYAPSSGGALVDIGVLPGTGSSKGLAINDLAQVVGNSDSLAFIWDSIYGMFNLNTLISASDQANWTLTSATGINDSDQITGVGLFDGAEHGFVLTPIPNEFLFQAPGSVPEPPTALLAMTALAMGAGWCRLRRGRSVVQADAGSAAAFPGR